MAEAKRGPSTGPSFFIGCAVGLVSGEVEKVRPAFLPGAGLADDLATHGEGYGLAGEALSRWLSCVEDVIAVCDLGLAGIDGTGNGKGQ